VPSHPGFGPLVFFLIFCMSIWERFGVHVVAMCSFLFFLLLFVPHWNMFCFAFLLLLGSGCRWWSLVLCAC
jgi:hypothetical protein